MLYKNLRLEKERINLVKKEGRIYYSKNFGFIIREREKDKHSKFCIIVSRKVSLKAVARNKLKRIISEVVNQFSAKLKGGCDIIIFAKKGSDVNIDEARKEIGSFFIEFLC